MRIFFIIIGISLFLMSCNLEINTADPQASILPDFLQFSHLGVGYCWEERALSENGRPTRRGEIK